MKLILPSPLHSYTGGVAAMECQGATLDEALQALDRRFPGIRFRMIDEQGRIRTHLRIYADGQPVTRLEAPLAGVGELLVIAALSGG